MKSLVALLGMLFFAACASQQGTPDAATDPVPKADETTPAVDTQPEAAPEAAIEPQEETPPEISPEARAFPLPIFPEAVVQDVTRVRRVGRRGGIVQMNLTTSDTPGEVMKFYLRAFLDKGLRPRQKHQPFGDGLTSVMKAKKRRLRVKVVATQNGANEPTQVTLTWNKG